MGEEQNQFFHLSFNASLKVGFQGSRATSDGGLIVVRQLEEHHPLLSAGGTAHLLCRAEHGVESPEAGRPRLVPPFFGR